MHRLTGHDPDAAREAPEAAAPALALWNPVPRERSGIVTAEVTWFRRDVLVGPPSGRTPKAGRGYRRFLLLDGRGEEIPVQVLGVRRGQERLDAPRHYPDQDEVDRAFVAFRPPPLPGMGLSILTPRPGRRVLPDEDLTVRPGLLANHWVRLQVADTGELTLEDRRTGERYAGLLRLEDEADLGDTYTFCPRPGTHPLSRATVARGGPAVVADGPLVGAVETGWSQAAAGGRVGCRLLVALRADSPLVRLRLDLDHRATDHRMRARFPLGAFAAEAAALAGAAWGTARRPPAHSRETNHPAERPVATAPAQRFVAAASGRRGLALFAPGFFEYEWTAKGDLLFTLLRAVGQLSRGDLPTRPGHAGWPMATPLAQEPGHHRVDLALTPVTEEDLQRPDRLVRLWEDAFLPIQAVFLRQSSGRPSQVPPFGVELEGEGLVFSALKPAESGDGLVLRCYNATASWVQGGWRFARPIRRALAVRGDETESAELQLGGDRSGVRLTAAPHQMVSVLVAW